VAKPSRIKDALERLDRFEAAWEFMFEVLNRSGQRNARKVSLRGAESYKRVREVGWQPAVVHNAVEGLEKAEPKVKDKGMARLLDIVVGPWHSVKLIEAVKRLLDGGVRPLLAGMVPDPPRPSWDALKQVPYGGGARRGLQKERDAVAAWVSGARTALMAEQKALLAQREATRAKRGAERRRARAGTTVEARQKAATPLPAPEQIAKAVAEELKAQGTVGMGGAQRKDEGPEVEDRRLREKVREALTPLQFKLHDFMWGKDEAGEQEAIEAVWGHECDRDQRDLKVLMSKARGKLRDARIKLGWSLFRRGGVVCKKMAAKVT
jgi:hypothetical protein